MRAAATADQDEVQEPRAWPAAGWQPEFAFRDRDEAEPRVGLPVVQRAGHSRQGVARPERFRYGPPAQRVAMEVRPGAIEAALAAGFPALAAGAEFPEAPTESPDLLGMGHAAPIEPVPAEPAPSVVGARAAV